MADGSERNRQQYRFDGDWKTFKASIVSRVMQRATGGGRLLLADGRVVEFNTVPLPDGSVLYSESDVTARYHIQRALVQRNEALQEADLLKTEFLALVSSPPRS